MSGPHITEHAIDRYCERVRNLPREAVRARLQASAGAIEAAARFGARVVRLGDGARLVLEGTIVVTVLGHEQFPPAVLRPARVASDVFA